MKLIPDTFILPIRDTMHTTRRRVLILGAILVVVAVGSLIAFYGVKSGGVPISGKGIPASSSTPETRQKQVDAMSAQSSATGTITQSSSTTVPVPTMSTEEIQKQIDAMQQKP